MMSKKNVGTMHVSQSMGEPLRSDVRHQAINDFIFIFLNKKADHP